MGIRTSLTDTPVKNTEPKEILITVSVDDKGGGGGSIQADVDSDFKTTEFSLVSDSASPTPDSIAGGDIHWKNRTIPQAGTTFTYRLTCVSGSKGGRVEAKACVAGGTSECASAGHVVGC